MDYWWKNIADQMRDDKETVDWECTSCGKIFSWSEKDLAIEHVQNKHGFGRLRPRLSDSAIREIRGIIDKSGQPGEINEKDFLIQAGKNYIQIIENMVKEKPIQEDALQDREVIVGTFSTEPDKLARIISEYTKKLKNYKFKRPTGYIKLTENYDTKVAGCWDKVHGLIGMNIRGTYWHRDDQALPYTLVSWNFLQLDNERVQLSAYVHCEEYFILATEHLSDVYDYLVHIKRKPIIHESLSIDDMNQALAQVKDHLWDRKLVVLYWNGHPIPEIARKLGKSEKTIRNRLSDLRQQYGEKVIPYCETLRNMRR